MKKSTIKLLALALCVLLISAGLVKNIMAEEEVNNTPKPMTVFSLDAGRKYFSPEQIKDIIDQLHDRGYTHMQLLLGNDGLRFLLDDMGVNVDGTEYDSEAVKTAIAHGNDAYYQDPNGNHLTESEMNEILAYAKSKQISIIPGINSPGHMDAILHAMDELKFENPRFMTSVRTVDLANEKAVKFTKALVLKYVDYFGSSIDYFTIGGDEYANDVDNAGGWRAIQKSGKYSEFVKYINDLTAEITDRGITPIAFNDGIYYNSDDSFGTFNTNLLISYWNAGWWGYDVAKPSYLQAKGHRILNTNDGWYYVLGHEESKIYNLKDALKNMKKKPFNEVPGAKAGEIDIVGSMHCLWCDDPSKPYLPDRLTEALDTFSTSYKEMMSVHEEPVIETTITTASTTQATTIATTSATTEVTTVATTPGVTVTATKATTEAVATSTTQATTIPTTKQTTKATSVATMKATTTVKGIEEPVVIHTTKSELDNNTQTQIVSSKKIMRSQATTSKGELNTTAKTKNKASAIVPKTGVNKGSEFILLLVLGLVCLAIRRHSIKQ